tara:strand:- start:1974 stop:2822 length:849 start_codon:yes stop_codon:yes gene_type:complete
MTKYIERVLPHDSMLGDDPTDIMAKSGRVILFTHLATGKAVGFKAYVTKFEDSYDSSWNGTQVYGRMDPIAVYQGTSRTISISWDVPSASAYDAYKNLQRISQMIRMLYPVYTNAEETGVRTLKAAPLLRMKFMNLSRDVRNHKGGLVGYVKGNFSYAPNLAHGVFDGDDGTLGMNGIFDAFDEPTIYPKVASLSCTFAVLHTHPLGFSDQWDDVPSGPQALNSFARNANVDNGPGEAYPYGVDRSMVDHPGDSATESLSEDTNAAGQQAATARALSGNGDS